MTGRVLRLRRLHEDDAALGDGALARACFGGDPAAVGALFDRFQQPVARYVSRLLANSEDVEDVVQATFLEVARGRSLYDGSRASVKTWLFAIATNVVRHHRRSTARRLRLVAELVRATPPAASRVEAQADARRKLDSARQALNLLPTKQREAFVLCELEGISAREAGAILGASEVAIWKRVSKARHSVRLAVLERSP